jgi:hypothetical protein
MLSSASTAQVNPNSHAKCGTCRPPAVMTSRLPCRTRPIPGSLWGGRRRDGKAGVRQHGKGDVPVPGVVAADLVPVEAGLVIGRLEVLLD